MNLRKSLDDAYHNYLNESKEVKVLKAMDTLTSFSQREAPIIPQYSLQERIRPLFGKVGFQKPAIGDHPDFQHFKGTDQTECAPIVTLFMDIESSTRLSLLYPLDKVRRIKNAFICITIELVKAFDGHIHRIMGDAVMAYFGGRAAKMENAVIDSLNCAALLRYFVDVVLTPHLHSEGLDDPFGLRVGIDYGETSKVLWSSYGYPGMEEVTATSFYVDVASKLQHAAGRNQIMLGQSLREFIDFPEMLLDQKSIVRDGQSVKIPYLEPNHTGMDGMPINYKQSIFKWKHYLATTAIGLRDSDYFNDISNNPLHLDIGVSRTENGDVECIYHPGSSVLAKGKWLRFKVTMAYLPRLPYQVTFEVENHGVEASTGGRQKGGEEFGNHYKTYEIQTQRQHDNIVHWETTAYRGFHYMTIKTNTTVGEFKRQVGIFVE